MNTTETSKNRPGCPPAFGSRHDGIAVAGAASLSPEHFAAAADENTIRPFHPTRRDTMTRHTYDKEITALLVVDPYNDFISEEAKYGIAFARLPRRMIAFLIAAGAACRSKGEASSLLCDASSIPSGRLRDLKYIAPIQKAAWKSKVFEYGTWGGEIRSEFEPKLREIVAADHWCSSGFANTDLDLQFKNHGIHQLIVIGLIAHTCIEATVRFAAELGYESRW